MLYSEVTKQFRLREGVLERFYAKGSEWRVVTSVSKYPEVSLHGKTVSVSRVIACLKYKRDLAVSDKVAYRSGNANTVRNVIIVDRLRREYVYKLPTGERSGKYPAFIRIHNAGERSSFEVRLGSYNNVRHHKAITLAVRAKYIAPESNPFRTLFEAGFKDEARKLVQDYARTLEGCTLTVS